MTPIDIKKPFAGYKDFDACVKSNSDKNDPQAYCATIMRDVEKSQATTDVKKAKVYLRAGQKAPSGASVQQGKSGGRYYEAGSLGRQYNIPGRPKENDKFRGKKIKVYEDSDGRLFTSTKDYKAGSLVNHNGSYRKILRVHKSDHEEDSMASNIRKSKVYLKPGQQAPEGVQVQTTEGGSQYYEGNAQPTAQTPPPAQQQKPQQQQTPSGGHADPSASQPTDQAPKGPAQGAPNPSAQQSPGGSQGPRITRENLPPHYAADDKEMYDADGNAYYTGDAVKVHPNLTSDPYNKKGQEGNIVGYSLKDDAVAVQFQDGTIGLYTTDAVQVTDSAARNTNPDTGQSTGFNKPGEQTSGSARAPPAGDDEPDVEEEAQQTAMDSAADGNDADAITQTLISEGVPEDYARQLAARIYAEHIQNMREAGGSDEKSPEEQESSPSDERKKVQKSAHSQHLYNADTSVNKMSTASEAPMAPQENSTVDKADPKEQGDKAPKDNDKFEAFEKRLSTIEKMMTDGFASISKALEAKKESLPGQTPGEKVKLPDSPAGETDIDEPPEGDKVSFSKQDLHKAVQVELSKAMKGSGYTPVGQTPRPTSGQIDLAKGATSAAADIIAKSKKGIVSVLDIKKSVEKATSARDQQIKSAVDQRLAPMRGLEAGQ